MYNWFRIRGFRCFSDLRLERLARVNLLAGRNGVGKTAVLEGLFLHCGAYNPELMLRIEAIRANVPTMQMLVPGGEAPWGLVFRFTPGGGGSFELEGQDRVAGRRLIRAEHRPSPRQPASTGPGEPPGPKGGPPRVVSSVAPDELLWRTEQDNTARETYRLVLGRDGLEVTPKPPPPPFRTFYSGALGRASAEEIAGRWSEIRVAGEESRLVEALRVVEPRLERVELLIHLGVPVLWGEVSPDKGMRPMAVMGDGVNRLTNYLLGIADCRGGVVLIDEVENGLHYSVLTDVWAAMYEAARRYDTQLFATTHSLECINAAVRALGQHGADELLIHRLERQRDSIRAVTIEPGDVEALMEMGLEVR